MGGCLRLPLGASGRGGLAQRRRRPSLPAVSLPPAPTRPPPPTLATAIRLLELLDKAPREFKDYCECLDYYTWAWGEGLVGASMGQLRPLRVVASWG
jgi:hypothetical protein